MNMIVLVFLPHHWVCHKLVVDIVNWNSKDLKYYILNWQSGLLQTRRKQNDYCCMMFIVCLC